jgi:FlaA1/EpsC-like NDP-sugar epimerase
MNRTAAKYLLDVGAWAVLAPLAFALRLEGDLGQFAGGLAVYTAVGLPLKAAAVGAFRLHRRAWRWITVGDLLGVATAVAAVTAVLLFAAVAGFGGADVPRSVPLIEAVLAMLALGGMRMAMRVVHERRGRRLAAEGGRRVLVVGAGNAGALAVREMLRHPEAKLVPVGFLDDDAGKRRQRVAGRPVLGGLDNLAFVARLHGVDEVLIAIPSAEGDVVRRVVRAAAEAGLKSRTLPPLHELVSGRLQISQLREVDVEDLLGRDAVRLDPGPIGAYVGGRTVLVTGAGGSIGSEIVRQIAPFGPARVVLLGRGENSVYGIDRELARTHPAVERHAVICDVRDGASLRAVFAEHRPDVVFHAAAHKHVPLMERNPEQAVFNNVGGTRNLAELAVEFGVERLVNVSTDKAVNPTNVMGASKRVAEMVVSDAARQCGGGCTMVSVRFGNVLGSRGSVVPLFREQIARGGPVTVTHPDMVRYFMTIPEAAQLVLQAGAFAESGRVYVLDMGDPVRIADLARDLILLSGLEPGRDVDVVFSGTRPGEKLFEELLTAEEGTEPSHHEKIFVARKAPPSGELGALLDRLFDAAREGTGADVRAAFRALVPTYRPDAAAPTGSGAVSSGDGAVSGDGALREVAPPVPSA